MQKKVIFWKICTCSYNSLAPSPRRLQCLSNSTHILSSGTTKSGLYSQVVLKGKSNYIENWC